MTEQNWWDTFPEEYESASLCTTELEKEWHKQIIDLRRALAVLVKREGGELRITTEQLAESSIDFLTTIRATVELDGSVVLSCYD